MKTKLFFIAILSFGFFASIKCAEAANHYVRQGASGNGLDWTNAYGNLPSDLTRGDTYYIADGSYGGYTFDDANSGTQTITVKKATVSDHGTDTGWQASYGDGQAVFSEWVIKTSYWMIDGSVGGGPGSFKSGHGFIVRGLQYPLLNLNHFGADNLTIRHVEVDGIDRMEGMGTWNCYSAGIKSVQNEPTSHYFGAGEGIVNSLFEYMYFHDMACPPAHTFGMNNNIFQYNAFVRTGRSGYEPLPHSEVWSGLDDNNITWRWNWIEDISNSALFAHVNGGNTSGVSIYGNIAWQTGLSGVHASYFIDTASAGTNNWKVYNNTLVGWNSGSAGLYLGSGSGNISQNNIWAHHPMASGLSIGGSHSYNGYYSIIHESSGADMAPSAAASEANSQLFASTPFNNYANGNFTLKEATNSGITLASPYNTDMFGNIRGADGVWDRGALEYVSGSTGDTTAPASPGGLTVR